MNATVVIGGAIARSDSSVAYPPEPHDAAKLASPLAIARNDATALASCELIRAFISPGVASVARMPMIETTISNSTSVNPDSRRIPGHYANSGAFAALCATAQIREAQLSDLTIFARPG